MSGLLHFEDFSPGQNFTFGRYDVTREEILDFARQFDPQPHHLDEEAGKRSILGGLSASGWHVSAMAMRLFADGMIARMENRGGPGVEDCRWLKPVRPGDILRLEAEVKEVTAPKSRRDVGFVQFEWRLFNQREQVASLLVTTMPARRGA